MLMTKEAFFLIKTINIEEELKSYIKDHVKNNKWDKDDILKFLDVSIYKIFIQVNNNLDVVICF